MILQLSASDNWTDGEVLGLQWNKTVCNEAAACVQESDRYFDCDCKFGDKGMYIGTVIFR